MIPDYLKFIRFQDKRIIPFFYFILFIVLGFYWKNNAYILQASDAWYISVILAVTLFNLIYELKSWWAYSCVSERIDVDVFKDKPCSKTALFFSRPTVVSVLSVLVFWLLVKACLLLPSFYNAFALVVSAPLVVYLFFRALRPLYIKQVLSQVSSGVYYKSIYRYVARFVALSTLINVLSVRALKANPDFSLSEGFFSAKLMVAMLILCAIVLAINLIFVRFSKRYIFLGRFFLKEIDFSFSQKIPFSALHDKWFIIRMLLLLVIEFIWIMIVSVLLALVGWNVAFEIYFLLCLLPCTGYYFLHLCWHWHSEFMMSFDMYFRYDEFKKRNN